MLFSSKDAIDAIKQARTETNNARMRGEGSARSVLTPIIELFRQFKAEGLVDEIRIGSGKDWEYRVGAKLAEGSFWVTASTDLISTWKMSDGMTPGWKITIANGKSMDSSSTMGTFGPYHVSSKLDDMHKAAQKITEVFRSGYFEVLKEKEHYAVDDGDDRG